MSVVVEAPRGCFLDRSVHALDLPVGPGMVWLCQAVVDIVARADQIEADAAERLSGCEHRFDVTDGPAFPFWISELDTIVG